MGAERKKVGKGKKSALLAAGKAATREAHQVK
jgi:hypothetical protein